MPARPLRPASEDADEAGPTASARPATRQGLVVRAPATYDAERRYILDLILSEWLGFDYVRETGLEPCVTIRLAGGAADSELAIPDVLFATAPEAWLREPSMPELPLARLVLGDPDPNVDGEQPARALPCPILFGDRAADRLWRATPRGLRLAIDVFGGAFFLLTGYADVVRDQRDDRGRSRVAGSLAGAEGFVDRPIVDDYVDALWSAMHTLWPGLERRPSTFSLRLTHDVDDVWAAYGLGLQRVLHATAGDFVRRHDPGLARRRLRALFASDEDRAERDPFFTFDFLMDVAERHGLHATFYFLAAASAGDDGHYSLMDRPINRLLRRIHVRGHEVGLHAGHGSCVSPERLRDELHDLQAACHAAGFEQPTWGVRQHWLSFDFPTTWRLQEAAGLAHDSTLGWVDQVGFRSGTCREFPVFDLLERRSLALRERPLLAMDCTLFNYMGLERAEGAAMTKRLVARCREHAGEAVLLYHNSWVAGAAWRRYYRDLVTDLLRPV